MQDSISRLLRGPPGNRAHFSLWLDLQVLLSIGAGNVPPNTAT
ncbi:hypothetical protein [Nocardia sp. NPDC005998]